MRVYLEGGAVYHGTDERDADEVVREVVSTEPFDNETPKAWTWIAGLYVRRDAVIAIDPR